MSIMNLEAGRAIPNDVNVVIEIPQHGAPVKYEVDKETGLLEVDRFMGTAMYYPANYGFVPKTLSKDGDPVDVLVLTPSPLLSGSLVRCRPIGLLNMEDEKGEDAKVLAVPITKVCMTYRSVETHNDVPAELLATINHFFEHYKDLEEGKWVKLSGWAGPEAAFQEILTSIERYRNNA